MNDTLPRLAYAIAHGLSVHEIAPTLGLCLDDIAPMLDHPGAMLEVLSTEAMLYIGHPLPDGEYNGTDANGLWS